MTGPRGCFWWVWQGAWGSDMRETCQSCCQLALQHLPSALQEQMAKRASDSDTQESNRGDLVTDLTSALEALSHSSRLLMPSMPCMLCFLLYQSCQSIVCLRHLCTVVLAAKAQMPMWHWRS